MKKLLPFILLVWPYLFFTAIYLDSVTPEGSLSWMLIYCVCTPIVYIANIVCASKTKSARSLSFWNMLMKILHIPVYVMIFMVGAMLAGQLIVGSPLGLIIVSILVVIDVLLLCTTSAYGICVLVRAKRESRISTVFMVVNIILHLLFVWDVISSIIVYCKIRKAKPLND